MITGTSPTMAPRRRTRIRPHMRRIRRLPSSLSPPCLPRSASMRTIWELALMSTSLRSLKSRNQQSQTHTLALSSNSNRRSRSWASAATSMRRSPLRSTLLEQVATLMYLPMTIPTPISPRRTPATHPPTNKQRRNKIPPPPTQELPPAPMPS